MEILLWILIIGLFITSFVALIFPILPSVVAIWGGFLIYHFFINPAELTWFFWISMAVITVALLIADIIAAGWSVKKFGGSKWGERTASIAVIVGSFIYPPLGIILIPLIAVFLVELLQKRTFQFALRSSFGSLIGFLTGTVAEAIFQIIMIIWFFLAILF